jgi:hypothetical protein
VARHIGGEDRGETAFDGISHSLPSRANRNRFAPKGMSAEVRVSYCGGSKGIELATDMEKHLQL